MPSEREKYSKSTPSETGSEGGFLEYCCPRCKGPLASSRERYRCEACSCEYPVLLGIPDFRVFPDPYIDLEDDRVKAQRLAEKFDEVDFRGFIDYYWSITPHEHPHLVQRYIRHALTAVPRGQQSLATVESSLPHSVIGPDKRFLEVGCGTGGFLVAASGRFDHVVGIDIAFRWLVIAKKQLEEAGAAVQLVCCCGEFLPFPGAQLDLIVAGDVLEHTKTQQALIQETHRVLRQKGIFFAATPNRLSLTPEPHVRLWGVGWLPRGVARRYVMWRRRLSYDNIYLVSRFELKRIVRRTSFGECQIKLPVFSEAEQDGLSRREQWLVAIYHRIKDWPLVHAVLLVVGPVLQMICVRRDPVTAADSRPTQAAGTV